MNLGIQADRFSDTISAGRLNKTRTLFVGEKQDVTNECIGAVADWARYHYEGAAEVRLGGLRVVIEVFDDEGAAS